MLCTKYLLQSAKDIPHTWIFEYYCNLQEKLTGQDVKIKSIFNPEEKTPSMSIFYWKEGNKYTFKDFSTGLGGTAIKLVQLLHKEDFYRASARILEDYNSYVLENNGEFKINEFKVQTRYKVKSATPRLWNTQDKSFWQKFGISSKLLEHYNIKPLQSYLLEKEEDGEVKTLEITGLFLYGYYTNDGRLYKIYQPKVKEHKFIKIFSYIQGVDQIEGHPFLIIASSMKDALVIKTSGIRVDVIAPDSENTMIKKEILDNLKKDYKKVLTLFDNDSAGIAAMKKYKEQHDIDYVYFDLEKDVADAVSLHGQTHTFTRLIPAITKKLN